MCACYVLCVKYEYVHGSVRGKCVYVYMSICVVCVCVLCRYGYGMPVST